MIVNPLFAVTWLCTIKVAEVEQFPPLSILYYPTEELYVIGRLPKVVQTILQSKENLPFSHVMFCCPYIDDKNSNSSVLYVKTTFERKTFKDILYHPQCPHQYQPSMITSSHGGYHFGYIISNIEDVAQNYNLPVILNQEGHIFSVYRVDFDHKQLFTFHTLHRVIVENGHLSSSNNLSHKCNGIGMENLLETNFANFYEENSQDTALENLQRPVARKAPNILPSQDSRTHYEYFTPHQLTPINDFVAKGMQIATCSYFNTTPVWRTIAEGPLKLLENYIRSVAEHLEIGRLEVLTKTYDKLKLPTTEDSQISQIVYLDRIKQRIPAAKILIKVLAYHVPYLEISNEIERDQFSNRASITNFYYIAFVIHNEIQRGEKICHSDVCRLYGWNIWQDDDPETSPYCCTLDDIIFKQTMKLNLPGKPFDLNVVPVKINSQGDVIEAINVVEELIKVPTVFQV